MTALLSLRGLCCRYGRETIIESLDLELARGEVLGVVGESGSGKSTLAKVIAGLQPRSAGEFIFDGEPLPMKFQPATYRHQARRVQMVFQDNWASLNPRLSAGASIAEPLRVHGESYSACEARVRELADWVGLSRAQLQRYPAELSGGQRQRVGIARALALSPDLLLCDEPVSALDVSVQAQVISLLQDLQQGLGLSMLFIAHDLAVVRTVADRVAVMQAGRILECGPAEQLLSSPREAYTQQLVAATPTADPAYERSRRDSILARL